MTRSKTFWRIIAARLNDTYPNISEETVAVAKHHELVIRAIAQCFDFGPGENIKFLEMARANFTRELKSLEKHHKRMHCLMTDQRSDDIPIVRASGRGK